MTQAETRQLGIEFERRVQTMIPEKEILDKLDTDTIYSFLNLALDQYIRSIYQTYDALNPRSKASMRAEKILKPFLTLSNELGEADPADIIVNGNNSKHYILPNDYYLYVRSVSKVTSTFNWTSNNDSSYKTLPNEWTTQSEMNNFIETPYDYLRIIRYPLCSIFRNDGEEDENQTGVIVIVHDRYTTIKGVQLVYYRRPNYFTLQDNTSVCELSIDCFEDILTLALDLYTQYVAGAEANKRRLEEQAKKAQERELRRNKEDQD